MPLVRKEVIRPGVYWFKDEKIGVPRKLTVTPGDDPLAPDGAHFKAGLNYFYTTGKKMLETGLSIPVPIEHQFGIKAMTAAEKAAADLKNNAGFVQEYEIGKVKDDKNQEVDALFSKLDIQDAEIAKKLPGTIRWTSPWIQSFTDGNGTAWNGVISHVALTTRPRITKQEPFGSIAAALSLTDKPAKEDGFAVTRAALLAADGDALKPLYPMAFSLWSGAKMAMEDEEKGKKEGPPTEGKKAKPADEESADADNLSDRDGDVSLLDVVCDLLCAEGYEVPEDVETDNALERMYAALIAKRRETNNPGVSTTPPPKSGQKPPVVAEQPPMYMSLEEVQKIEDPKLKGVALSLLESQKKNAAMESHLISQAKSKREARITKLAKHLPQAARDQLLAQSQSMKFSLGDDGVIKDEMDVWLSVLESGMRELPNLLTMSTEERAALAVAAHPEEFNPQGGISGEEAEKWANQLSRKFPKETKRAG